MNTSDNGDLQVFAIMIVLTILLALLPFIPGLRSIPRWTRLYRLIWRQHYREVERGGGGGRSPPVDTRLRHVTPRGVAHLLLHWTEMEVRGCARRTVE